MATADTHPDAIPAVGFAATIVMEAPPASRRLEREAQRNLALMWLLGRLAPDFKTIANFRKDNPKGIRGARRQFVVMGKQARKAMRMEYLTAIADRGHFKSEEILACHKARQPLGA